MAFFTKEQARAAAKRTKVTLGSVTGTQSYSSEQYDPTQRFDIFLSHSIADKDLVLGVKELLEEKHYTVYVDWVNDEELDRTQVNKETADLLRNRMQHCSSLVYIATDNAENSKWMPWELGYFDGQKAGGVAIMPLVESERSGYNGQEYLGLYPLVIEDDSQIYVEGVSEGRIGLYAFVNDTSR
ncbi:MULTISPECIES: toll/interleukin-1 receptor domain-containing protein [Pseudomonas]|uniref:TIR domain-containing protein n=1 Tax=Pseudomonas putida (strain W619) TaxID=390235 RepID=B1JB70_PSEPW|nr:MULTISPECIES: toll/interleukin-1 receptor domain-containing protein [Pseudomonas]ERT19166.1 toll-Interleukin receptor [Pseudomonas putida SJ3]NMX42414.1 TIR domain-containing protein [Pseudomonas veronii]AJG12529.1 hypothetical protein RK21_01021 [Pseudomonas plecoglossicida]EKT4450878.1 toll/interleukin-1 receptor domain-containing protein [Pseudomonas putida]KSG00433.1 toll-Interleukin receptor [Pseudomonas aeruginosa]